MANEHKHVKQQFDDRVKTQLGTTYSISYDGYREWEDDALPDKYLETAVLGPGSSQPATKGARVENWLFQITANVRVNPPDVGYNDVWALVDDIYAAFDRTKVDVVDWEEAAPRPVVARLHFGQTEADKIPGVPEVQRVAVTIPATVTKA